MANTEISPNYQQQQFETTVDGEGQSSTVGVVAELPTGRESVARDTFPKPQYTFEHPFDEEPTQGYEYVQNGESLAFDPEPGDEKAPVVRTSSEEATRQQERDEHFRQRLTRDRNRREGRKDETLVINENPSVDTTEGPIQEIVQVTPTDKQQEIAKRTEAFDAKVAADRNRRSDKRGKVQQIEDAVNVAQLQRNIHIESQPLIGGGQITKGDAIDTLGQKLGSTRSPEGMVARAALKERGIEVDSGWDTILARARLKLGLAKISDIKEEKDRRAVAKYKKTEATTHKNLAKQATKVEKQVGKAAVVVEETVRQREGARFEPYNLQQRIAQVERQIEHDNTVLMTPSSAPGVSDVGLIEAIKSQAAEALNRFALEVDIERQGRKVKKLNAALSKAQVNTNQLGRAEEAATSAREVRRSMTNAAEEHAREGKLLDNGQISTYLEDQIRNLSTEQFIQLVGGRRADLRKIEGQIAGGQPLSEAERVRMFREFAANASPASIARKLAKIINSQTGQELLAMKDTERNLPEYLEATYRSTATKKQRRRDNAKAIVQGVPLALAGTIFRAIIKD